MRDLARHQELQRVLGAGVRREVDEPFVDDFGAGLRGDVAAQVDVELAGDFQVVGRPRIAHRVEQIDAAAAGDRDERIGFGGVAIELHRLQMQARQGADDLQMAQLFGANIHQEILALQVVAVQALNGILHRGGKLAIRAAELFQQHVAERGSGSSTRTVYISFLTWWYINHNSLYACSELVVKVLKELEKTKCRDRAGHRLESRGAADGSTAILLALRRRAQRSAHIGHVKVPRHGLHLRSSPLQCVGRFGIDVNREERRCTVRRRWDSS